MSALLAAAPAVPAAGGAAVIASITGLLLVLLVASLATWMLIKLYDYTTGALLRLIADAMDAIPFFGGWAADQIEGADRFLLRQLGSALNGLNFAVAETWDGLTWVVTTTADAVYDLAAATAEAITGVVQGEIPSQIDLRVGPLADRLSKTRTGLNERLRAEALARSRGIDALDRDLTAEALARERGIDAVNRKLGEVVLPRVRGLERGLEQVWGYTRRTLARRLSRVEQLVLGGALTAAAVRALDLRFPFYKCTNVRRFNKALCRSPIGDWTGLLGLLAFVVVALDPERMAQLAEDLTDELGGIIADMTS